MREGIIARIRRGSHEDTAGVVAPLRNLFAIGRRERELAAELDAHLQAHVDLPARRATKIDPLVALRNQ